jgi:hypothetical protein
MDPEQKQVERQKKCEEAFDATLGAKVSLRLKKEIEDIAKEQGHTTVSSFLREVLERLISDDRRLKNASRPKLITESASEGEMPPALL